MTLFSAAAFALAASAAFAQEITVTHAQGETVLPDTPAKVITFDIASLDTLDALGVEIIGLPGTNLPEYLSKYSGEDYLKVGTLFEPDYEAVAAAEPDLIIVAGRSSAAYPELARIAPTVDLSNDWADFEGSVKRNSQVLGEIFGKTAEIEEMIAEFDARKAEVQAAAADAGTGLVVLTSGGEVTAYGPGSRFGWIHETAGVAPAIEDVEAATHGDAISFEFILETNPDWLFVIDREAATAEGGAAAQAVLDNELVAQTTAWSQGQVVYIDPVRSYIVNGGLPALTYLIDQVGDALAE
ncbi:iron ABC transporter substrate-binding protein [Devosia geojensis]|uniref:Iron ABC transporter substrate-binding protein n=1 Tax=Devosia geojensis TaxID=443610 RepID=A0A0F5FWK1_9HYPH|nr:iron ABC transporter substrate-binding protein [Devosia geojensis]